MSEFMGNEISPGKDVQSDEEILDFIGKEGESAYHLSGTCRSDGLSRILTTYVGINNMGDIDYNSRIRNIHWKAMVIVL